MSRNDLAPMKPQVYADPRPASYFDRFHQHARSREPDSVYALVRVLSYPYCRVVYQLHAEQIENVPLQPPRSARTALQALQEALAAGRAGGGGWAGRAAGGG